MGAFKLLPRQQWRIQGEGGEGGSLPLSKQGAESTSMAYGRARSLCDRLFPAVQSASPF